MEQEIRTISPDHNQIRTEVVTTYEQLLHAYAIRSICLEEQAEPGSAAAQSGDGVELPGPSGGQDPEEEAHE